MSRHKIEAARRAVRRARAAKQRLHEAISLEALGDALNQMSNPAAALLAWVDAIAAGPRKRCGDHWAPSNVFGKIAAAHAALEEWAEEVIAQRRLVARHLVEGEHRQAWLASRRLADRCRRLGLSVAEIAAARRAVKLARKVGPRELAVSSQRLAQALRLANRLDEAIAACLEVGTLLELPGERLRLLEELAMVHAERTEWAEASRVHQLCFRIYRDANDPQRAWRAASRAGELLGRAGDFPAAIVWARQAVEIARAFDRASLPEALSRLGGAFSAASQTKAALAAFQQAQAAGLDSPDLWSELAELHEAIGSWDDAIASQERCFELLLADGQSGNASRAALAIADIQARRGDISLSIYWCRRSVLLARVASDPRDLTHSLERLGYALMQGGRLGAALLAYEDAIANGKQLEQWPPPSAGICS
jgi:tetratricopeptide (TPR) repeat protein